MTTRDLLDNGVHDKLNEVDYIPKEEYRTMTINKAYSCLSLTKEDFDEEARERVANFSDAQMQEMADYIGECLSDNDHWNTALDSALERATELGANDNE